MALLMGLATLPIFCITPRHVYILLTHCSALLLNLACSISVAIFRKTCLLLLLPSNIACLVSSLHKSVSKSLHPSNSPYSLPQHKSNTSHASLRSRLTCSVLRSEFNVIYYAMLKNISGTRSVHTTVPECSGTATFAVPF